MKLLLSQKGDEDHVSILYAMVYSECHSKRVLPEASSQVAFKLPQNVLSGLLRFVCHKRNSSLLE